MYTSHIYIYTYIYMYIYIYICWYAKKCINSANNRESSLHVKHVVLIGKYYVEATFACKP